MCDFSSAKVGDKVFDIHEGEGVIFSIKPAIDYPIAVKFESFISANNYTIQGFYHKQDALPTLYWSKPEIIAPPQPKRMVKKSGWLNIYSKSHCFIYDEKTSAEAAAAKDRKSCIFIEWEEEE